MRRVFRLPGGKKRIDREVDDELRFHLEGRVEELMERDGLARGDAEREAARRFGDYDAYRREARDIDDVIQHRRHRMELLEAVARETRRAARSLRRAPSFSVIAAFTLALGLGAATTIFTLLDRVVIRPLPYPSADRLVHLGTLWPKVKEGEEYMLSKGQYFYLKRHSQALADIAMYDEDMLVVPGDAAHPAERVPEVDVSASTFRLLGIRPELGRAISEDDERLPNGDPRYALISHGYWLRRFGGDPRIVGKRLMTGDTTSLEIVGVLPAGATIPDVKADVWIRESLNPNDPPINNHTHPAIGLLKSGVTVAAALADVKRVQQRMQDEHPAVYQKTFLERSGFAMNVTSLRDHVVGAPIVRGLWLIFGAVGFVLLIAAANVANLFLVRIEARRREVAVRTALGADRAHLAIHYLTESVLLALAAGVAAVAMAAGLLHVVLAIAPQTLPRLAEVAVDGRGVGFCLGSALAFGAVFGVLPLGASSRDLASLRDGGRGLTSSKSREVARRGLVLAQVALAVVLLAGAGLMTESFVRLRQVHPGFDPDGVETMSIIVPRGYGTAQQAETFWRSFIARVETIPGVLHAGAVDQLPLSGGWGCSGLTVDVTNSLGESGNCMPMGVITPGYLETMGIKFAGAAPTWAALEARTAPTVVTSAFAKRFWEDGSALGHVVKPYNPSYAFPVVAVTEDIRSNGLQNPPIQEVLLPMLGTPAAPNWNVGADMTLVIKAPGVSTSLLVPAVRAMLARVEPKAIVADVQPMELVVAKSMAQTSFTMLLMLIAAAIALVLSAVGIYGVIAYVVGQRRSEIGIRIALGAQLGAVTRLVVGQSLTIVAAGVALGVGCALAGTLLLRTLLFDVSPSDPLVLGATAMVLLVVAVLASAGPARRVAKIDPVEAMRE
jgi:putative ABC transport system permease protein